MSASRRNEGARLTGLRGLVFLSSFLLTLLALETGLRLGLIETRHHDHLLRQGYEGPDTRKLLILGDSFLDRRTELNRFLVEQLTPRKVTILNLAVSGMGPREYLWELEAYGESFGPDLVLLSYYVGNDLTDVQYRADEATGIEARIKSRLRSLVRQSYLYHFLKERLDLLRLERLDYARILASGIDPHLVELAGKLEMNPSLLDLGMRKPDYLLDNILMETPENLRAWRRIEGILERIHVLSTSMGAQLILVIFPRSIQVNRSHFDFFRKLRFHLDERTLVSNRPQTLLRSFCADRHIHCLDLLPSFRAHGDEELYSTNDDHLNREGNELAAGLISELVLRAPGG